MENPENPAVRFAEIARQLRDEVLAGRYGTEGRMPSETQLVKRFGVSRPTVARALRVLADEGLLERRAGSGTFARQGGKVGTTSKLLALLVPGLGNTEIFQLICGELASLARMHDYGLVWGGSDYGWDGRRLAVMGDSAGGNLAAVVALHARDNAGPRILLQVMVYPVLDHDYETASYRQFGSSWGVLTRTDMIGFHSQYVTHPDQLDLPHVSPLRCTDLSGLPRALLILPEADPLRDEGLRYAEALRNAGVAAEARVYPGMLHGFWQLGGVLPQALTAIEDVASVLRSHLTPRADARAHP